MQHNLPLKSVICQPLKAFDYTLKKRKHSSMKLADRLRAAREAAGYSQEELAKKVGIVQQSLQKIEAGIIQNPRKLPIIESILGLPTGYLLYGDNAHEKASALPQPIVARCPILTWDKALEWPKNRLEILKDSEIKPLAQHIILGANCYALKIHNDSMTDKSRKQSFNEGSYIIIDPDIKHKSGNLVIATENETELLFRRYVKEAGREYLFAYNPNYEAVRISEDIKICGVVVAHLDVLI